MTLINIIAWESKRKRERIMLKSKLNYWKRVIAAYRIGANSQLTFWHEKPVVNENMNFKDPATGYYMTFYDKTLYPGPFDDEGVPLLDYKGIIGEQYNPIAIAQYGLGFYNRYVKEGNKEYLNKFLTQCDWLVENLEKNKFGLYVWMHYFDWEYFQTLRSPWYSSLSQGSGISALVRAYIVTKNEKYMDAAHRAMESFNKTIEEGGVTYVDNEGNIWFEEAITKPPTHILNGFIWSLWGVYDYYSLTDDKKAKELFIKAINTVKNNLYKYDAGYWSLYDLAPTKMKMLASPFYHSLHITQLKVLNKITGESIFADFSNKWDRYKKSFYCSRKALLKKMVFKIFYY